MKIGTSGFRGIIGEDFTKEEVLKIAQCTCDIIKLKNFKREVVVGYDNRFMSDFFAKWFCEVLVANDIKVRLTSGSVPSPLVSFATKALKLDLSVMITASHNPYYYNGIKLFSQKGVDLEFSIEDLYIKRLKKTKKIKAINFDKALEEGKIETFDFVKEYVSNIVSIMNKKTNFRSKVIFNVMNGSSLCAVSELKNQLNLKNLELYNTHRDPLFMPNPSSEEALTEFKKYALKKKFDFSFATDGDGDRLALIDEKGKFHNGNEIACLIYDFAITHKNQSGGFVKNMSFSKMADLLTKKLGTELFETPIGFKYISKTLIEKNALVGAENSGFEFNGHVYTKDGLIVFALLLEIVEFYQKPMSKILKELKTKIKYNMHYQEVSFRVKDREAIVKKLKNPLSFFTKKIKEINIVDGNKYIFEDSSWILIRFSGTENLIRIVAEQPTKRELEDIISVTKDFIGV